MTEVFFLVTCLAVGGADGAIPDPDRAESELAKIVGRLEREKKGAAIDGLVQAGAEAIQAADAPALDEELRFVLLVTLGSKFPEDAKRLEGVLELLLARAGRDDASRARVLAYTAKFYRNQLGNYKKEQELLLQAEKLHERVQIRHAKQQVQVWLRLGDSYSQDRKKALEYYAKVLAFPVFEKPYGWSSESNEFKELYIKAALRTVEISDEAQIPSLRFHPFAFPSITRLHPERAKLLSGELPEVAAYRARMIWWFEQMLKAPSVRMNEPLREHVEAVLKHARTGR